MESMHTSFEKRMANTGKYPKFPWHPGVQHLVYDEFSGLQAILAGRKLNGLWIELSEKLKHSKQSPVSLMVKWVSLSTSEYHFSVRTWTTRHGNLRSVVDGISYFIHHPMPTNFIVPAGSFPPSWKIWVGSDRVDNGGIFC